MTIFSKDLVTKGVTLIVGKKYTGKSWLLKQMMRSFIEEKRFDYGYILTGTKVTGYWDIIPEKHIYSEYKPELIESIYKKQEEFTAKGVKMNCFIIFDDILGDVSFEDPIMLKLITKGRHIGLGVYICTQHFKALKPIIRINSEYLIFFRMLNKKVIESIWEENGGALTDDMKLFVKWFRDNVKDRTALLIDNITQSNDPKDIYHLVTAGGKIKPYFLKF